MSWFNFLTSIGKETEANAFEELILTEGTVFNFIYLSMVIGIKKTYIAVINTLEFLECRILEFYYLLKGIFVHLEKRV